MFRIQALLLCALGASTPARAFVPLSNPSITKPFFHRQFITGTTSNVLSTPPVQPQQQTSHEILTSSSTVASKSKTALAASPTNLLADGSMMTDSLTKLLLETIIINGVPAVFTLLVIGFAAFQFRPRRNKDDDTEIGGEGVRDRFGRKKNPAAELYSDLYEGDEENRPMSPFSFLRQLRPPGGGGGGDASPASVNRGVPALQYIKIKNVNKKYDSYDYSLTAATESKAKAAAALRAKNFDRALGLALNGANSDALVHDLSAYAKTTLLELEKQFLKDGSKLLNQIQEAQTELTKTAIDEEMEAMGMEIYELDPPFPNATAANESGAEMRPTTWDKKAKPLGKGKKGSSSTEAIFGKLTKAQKNLMKMEMDFIKDVVATLGSERATGIRAALLGDIAARGTGGLLTQLQERPLSVLLRGLSTEHANGASAIVESDRAHSGRTQNLFVTRFPGDVQASQVTQLREEVTAIVRSAKPGDEALVVLQSGGGTVTGYGLAAAQLLRFKEAGMKLTIAVEQVAASGGYMMCCVADKIVSSPFAVLGSIGVISDIPNVYQRLKDEGIEFQTVTAGKYKRTITPTKRVTKEDFEKTKQDVEGILTLFKKFVHQNRPSLDIDEVATGKCGLQVGPENISAALCRELRV